MKKVLRAIGGFFAKIGRWIANTAWIQPLLIVGGIFAVIFSIPYIKSGIEGLIAANQVNEDVAYYTGKALSLAGSHHDPKGESKADDLFYLLEDGSADAKAKIRTTYGEKFFLTFAKEDCSNCTACVDGFRTLEANFADYKLEGTFKMYTIMVDTLVVDTDSQHDGEYAAKFLFNHHKNLFDEIVEDYVEDGSEYDLFTNLTSDQVSSMKSSISKLDNPTDDAGEGLDVPSTFLIDLTEDGAAKFNVKGITAILFNYTSIMTADNLNPETKAQFLRDCWSYSNMFERKSSN